MLFFILGFFVGGFLGILTMAFIAGGTKWDE